jgi:hypothetical protein
MPRLDAYCGAEKRPCSICSLGAGWLLHDCERYVALCDACAAQILFSDPKKTSSLIEHLPSGTRNTLLFKLWQARSAS